MPRVTLREVANRAGVSMRTVSNVVNDFPYVATHTRERVQAAIDELGYRPNWAARHLRRGPPVLVELAVAEIDAPEEAEIAALLIRAAEARDWAIRLCQTNGDPEFERAIIDGRPRQDADAFILCPRTPATSSQSPPATIPPVVVLADPLVNSDFDHVSIDNCAAADRAASHLLEIGRRRIGIIGPDSQEASSTLRNRLRGYHQALARAGIALEGMIQVDTEATRRLHGAHAMQRLLRLAPAVDSVLCVNDSLALGAMHTLDLHERRIPDDVAVVGFGNIEDSAFSRPALSTVGPDKHELVELALRCVAERLSNHRHPARTLHAGYHLHVRGSSTTPGADRRR